MTMEFTYMISRMVKQKENISHFRSILHILLILMCQGIVATCSLLVEHTNFYFGILIRASSSQVELQC